MEEQKEMQENVTTTDGASGCDVPPVTPQQNGCVTPENGNGMPRPDVPPVPPQNGYGVPPQSGNGMPRPDVPPVPSQNGYGVPPQSGNGMPRPDVPPVPSQNGYGVPPQSGNGMPRQDVPPMPSQNGYGIPSTPLQNGYGVLSTPPQNGYGVPPMPPQNGYGVPQQGNYRMMPQGDYGQKPSEGLAIASMILGIVSILACIWFYIALPCGVVGLILGCVYRSKGGRSGMSVAGIACSSVGIAFGLFMLFAVILDFMLWI